LIELERLGYILAFFLILKTVSKKILKSLLFLRIKRLQTLALDCLNKQKHGAIEIINALIG
jgi:hypothetical protein